MQDRERAAVGASLADGGMGQVGEGGEQCVRRLRERPCEGPSLVQAVAPVCEEQHIDPGTPAPAAENLAQRLAGADVPEAGVEVSDACLDSSRRTAFTIHRLGYRRANLAIPGLDCSRGRFMWRHVEEGGLDRGRCQRQRNRRRRAGYRDGQPKSTKRRTRPACSAGRRPADHARTLLSAA